MVRSRSVRLLIFFFGVEGIDTLIACLNVCHFQKEKNGYSVVLPSNSSGFANASAFVLRTVPSMCSGGE